MRERRRNVYENKGPAFHSPEQSANVTENTGSYEFKQGMSLKRNDIVGELFSWQSLMPPAAPRNDETTLSFRAERGILLRSFLPESTQKQSEIPRSVRNGTAFSKQEEGTYTSDFRIACSFRIASQ
jgi:hypothetical protein